MRVSKDREYVLASNKHRFDNKLQFWGRLTDDDEKRSFGGYYTNLDICERYSKDDIRRNDFPILDETASNTEIFTKEHFYIKVEHLKQIQHIQVETATTVERCLYN